MLLARTVAHTLDVDGMLATMAPRQFDEWLAMWRLQHWGIEPQLGEAGEQKSSLDTFKGLAGF